MRSGCGFVILCLLAVSPSRAQETPRAISDFGIRFQQGRIVHPLPPNIVLCLYNPDALPDVTVVEDGVLKIFQNLGNGLYEHVRERTDAEARRSKHEFNQVTHMPDMDFREVWRSQSQSTGTRQIVVDDVDNDGSIEIAYCLIMSGDSNRLVVYESIGPDLYAVDWDTVLQGSFGPHAVTDVDNNGEKEIILNNGSQIKLLECQGDGRYQFYTTTVQQPGFAVLGVQETDVDHDSIRELTVLFAHPSPPIGVDPTFIHVAEFAYKGPGSGGPTFGFNEEVARYPAFAFEMAVGQIDGIG